VRLIPAIDLKAGHCVRLLRGSFDNETRYSADPLGQLEKYRALGARWVHIVDLDGARDGSFGNHAIIMRMAAQRSVQLQVGGGIRNTAAVAQMLDAGIERVVVGSAAVTQPDQVQAWLRHFGSDRLTLAFDVRLDGGGTPCVATHGWLKQSSLSLWEALDAYREAGLKHVLCTDVERDGAMSGPNLDLYRNATRRYPHIRWQASGGIRDARDLQSLKATGTSAAISGKALLEELIPLEELQPFLPNE
jgi:phosphoribosylformimino-5-aminoimidazole carboxamide ribotide isomerase